MKPSRLLAIFDTVTRPWGHCFGDVGRAYKDFFSDQGYRDAAAYRRDLDELAVTHHDRLSLHPLPVLTHQGRQITVARVEHPDLPPAAPTILVTGLLHAREFIGGEMAMAFLAGALEDDGPIAELARHCAIDVVPMVNPDGVAINEGRIKGWRKRFGPLWRGNANGVDLNRNFPHNYSRSHLTYWLKLSAEYAGTGPASEPESQALIKLWDQRRYAAAINLHSWSNVLLYPYFSQWGTDELVEKIAAELPDVQPHEPYHPVRGSLFYRERWWMDLAFRLIRGTRWVHGTFDDWLLASGTHSLLIEITRPRSLFAAAGLAVVSDLAIFNPAPADRQWHIDNVLPVMHHYFHRVLAEA